MTITIDGTNGITSPPVLTLQAGTATTQPILLTSGTNLTAAVAGSIEYDGKVMYATPQGTQRGVIPEAQFFRLNADLAGANVSTAQNIFGVGVTLSSSTVYEFEFSFGLSKTAGSTARTTGLSFAGTATVNNIGYSVFTRNNAGLEAVFVSAVSNTTVTLSTGVITETAVFSGRGTISVNAGGTFIPQYTLSAAPGGAYSTVAGSYFMIYPVGASGANTSVGAWA